MLNKIILVRIICKYFSIAAEFVDKAKFVLEHLGRIDNSLLTLLFGQFYMNHTIWSISYELFNIFHMI